MSRKIRKIVMIVLIAVCLLSLGACGGSVAYNKPIEETDLASTYVGDGVDLEGNLLVPFDVAYSEVFESGVANYSKDHVLLKMPKSYTGKRTNDLRKCGIASLEKFSEASNGNWWKAILSGDYDVLTALKKARSLSEVLVADLDYVYSTDSVLLEDISDIELFSSEDLSGEEAEIESADVSWAHEEVRGNKQLKDLYHLKLCDIQQAWKFLEKEGKPVGGLSSVVVAVIDTGVDYTHPDLKANMWVNPNEIPGNGIDDDNNGYIDDVHGANTIADNGGADGNEGDPMDDHGHGTHVAGIIGATNNKEGIVGVAYNCKIMAVKASQTSGVFLQSDIAEAILYAYSMGADVINMSFGGMEASIAVQDALMTAYTTASLVAAAGNNGVPNQLVEPGYTVYKKTYFPIYPGAYPYVTGVMSCSESYYSSTFSNWDPYPFNNVEYEVYAPGEYILSTLPNGRYGKLSGTSMASPVVAGIAALVRSYYTDRDIYPSKFVSAQISAVGGTGGNQIANAYLALTKTPLPQVWLNSQYLFDDTNLSEVNNGDGIIDAGEVVDIGFILRNRYGMAKDTVITVDAIGDLGVANPYVEFINDSANFGEIGTYSTKHFLTYNETGAIVGTQNAIRIKIAENCPNDYLISLNVYVSCKNGLNEDDETVYNNDGEPIGIIEFWVRNGVILTGQITEDTTLTKDNYYIIPSSLYIAEGATVTVEEGTQIQFWSDDSFGPYADANIAKLTVAGNLIVNGTLENPVLMFPSEMCLVNYPVNIVREKEGYVEFNYATVSNAIININKADHCTFNQVYDGKMYNRVLKNGVVYIRDVNVGDYYIAIRNAINCIFYKLGTADDPYSNIIRYYSPYLSGKYDTCTFVDSVIHLVNDYHSPAPITKYYNCTFMGNQKTDYVHEVTTSSNYEFVAVGSFEFVDVQTDSQTGHSYVRYKQSIGGLETLILRSFAQYLGGDFACFETEEEWNKWKKYSFGSNIGITSWDYKHWINGESLGDYIGINEKSYPKNGHDEFRLGLVYTSTSGQDYFITDSSSGSSIIEIPKTIDSDGNIVNWTEELLTQKYNEWVELGLNNVGFSGNAILNNFNYANPGMWLRMIGGEKPSNADDHLPNVGLSGNYWGTTDEDLIEKMIVDFDDYSDLIDINVGNYLTTPPENTFPFVTDAYILNEAGERVKKVGNEKVTFVVEFNRDMDTTVPLRFSFGSSIPYAEYEVEGAYLSPRRWEGEYTLKTIIENGINYFNIENARAESDHFLTLHETPARFKFEIDTTEAMAMIMQGEATDTGINLTWVQDDFETLLGYNVYRSEQEDGYYTRLNDYVLSYEENSFFDDTVEPGKVYYYNFTVVQTDLTESKPSGKIVIRSKDTMAPNIYHSPVRTAYTGNNLLISATITDNLQVQSAKVYYREVGATEWKTATMNALNSKYTAIIGAENITLNGLEYYIEAFDGISYTYKGSSENAYTVTVKLAVDSSAIGDVDGDGAITVKDAQMLLMAINDLLNLTEEQFLRADIDGSGNLESFEAMRILDYVSGKVTTILL